MEPLVFIVVPGFIGGTVLAWLFIRLHRGRPSDEVTDTAYADEPPPTDVINMARIRVGGVGGLVPLSSDATAEV